MVTAAIFIGIIGSRPALASTSAGQEPDGNPQSTCTFVNNLQIVQLTPPVVGIAAQPLYGLRNLNSALYQDIKQI